MNHKITEIFCLIDEFCKEFEKVKEGHILEENAAKKRRNRKFKMSDSEIITVVVYFHFKGYRCLKHFYIEHVQKHMTSDFPETVSYNRFVELQQKALIPMVVFLQLCCLEKCTGISFIDSTPIRVCHIRREYQHKPLRDLLPKENAQWDGSLDLNSILLSTTKVKSWIFFLPRLMLMTVNHSRIKTFMTKYLENS